MIAIIINVSFLTHNTGIQYALYICLMIPVILAVLHFDKSKNIINIFISAIFVMQIFLLGYEFFDVKQASSLVDLEYDAEKASQIFTKKRNVYYLVADTYPSRSATENEHINNDDFLAWLASKKFSVNKEAFSNYPATISSMSATFTMKHHKFKGVSSTMGHSNKGADIIYRGKNIVVKNFLKNGYSIYLKDMTKLDDKKNKAIVYNGTDLKWFCDYMRLTSFITRIKYKFDKYKDIFLGTADTANVKKVIPQRTFSNFITNFSHKEEPMFVYLHSYELHAYTSNCIDEPINRENVFGFVQQLKCVNNDIKKVVNYIQKNDENAIIILQADHGSSAGYRFSNENYKDEITKRFGILFAVKWPAECVYLGKEKYTPINLFPRVFDCLSGTKPNYGTMQGDDSYLFSRRLNNKYDGSSEVVKVIENNQIILAKPVR